jgi:hypothetical protein
MEEDDKGLGQKPTIQKSDKGLEDLFISWLAENKGGFAP